jgi:peptidoglycan hydrolase-like protein with peptidoglycan-binding domain
VRPIRKGDRGPAVEDVQRRLLVLGADLGGTGVDGVFLGATLSAVSAFQREHRLAEDGLVGPETWAALVDATFTLGDRLLYLRVPYFHGQDVRSLQRALNALGFACGQPDGIFGAFSERAVREFQLNVALDADGIVGLETVRAIENLRHVWADKSSSTPVELHAAPARSAQVLARLRVDVVDMMGGSDVAGRLVNLALASEPGAQVSVVDGGVRGEAALTVEFRGDVQPGVPVVSAAHSGDTLARRFAAAVSSAPGPTRRVVVLLDRSPLDEHSAQALAVALLDGLCAGMTPSSRS